MIDFYFEDYKGEIKFYPYRTATVYTLLSINEPHEYDSLIKKICKKVGVTPDNHICFYFVEANIGLMFSDCKIYIGKLVEGRW